MSLFTVLNIVAFVLSSVTFLLLFDIAARANKCRDVLRILLLAVLMLATLVEWVVFVKLLIWEFSEVSHEALLNFSFSLKDYLSVVIVFILSLVFNRKVHQWFV